MKLIFDTHGNEKQKEAVRAWNDPNVTEIVYGGSKGSAKSFTGCSLIFGDALMYPGTHYYIARKTLKNLRAFTIPSIYEVFDLWGIDKNVYLKYNGQDNYFELPNESRVYLLDAKYLPSDPEYARFGSMQFTRGWIEEAGEFEEECKTNLQASLGRKLNQKYGLAQKLLQTCNPSHNYLFRDYKKHKEGTLEPYKRFIQALPTDNKMLGDEYIENLHRTLTGSAKERLLYGNWEYDDSEDKLVTYDQILDCFTNDHVRPGKPYASFDLAMQGRDKFVGVSWLGNIASIDIVKDKSDAAEIENDVNAMKRRKRIPNSQIIADSDGLGAYLSSYVKNIKEFHGGAKAKDPTYGNIKDECAYALARAISNSDLRIICDPKYRDIIAEELSVCLTALSNDLDKKRIIPKSKQKDMLGRSPDFFDALMMRFYFDVKKTYNITA